MCSLFSLVFINKLIFFETPKIMPNGTGVVINVTSRSNIFKEKFFFVGINWRKHHYHGTKSVCKPETWGNRGYVEIFGDGRYLSFERNSKAKKEI